MNDKKAYHHGDLRSALLTAGDAILERDGLQGFTLRKCAKAAGVSHAAPQHHFGNVEGLLTAIAAGGFRQLVAALEEQLQGAGGALEQQFTATATAYAQFAETYPEHFRVMFRCDLLNMDDADLRAAAFETYRQLTNVIRRQRGEDEWEELQPTDSSALISDILVGWCFVHGYAHLQLEQQLSLIPKAQRQQLRNRTAERLSQLLQAGS